MKDDTKLVIQQELESLKKRIIANHERAGQVASGRTRASLRVEVNDKGGILWGRKAFGTLETGRKPGKVPRGFYQIILQWVKDKKINVDNPKTFAYFVSKKIANEGTELFRKGGRADIYSNEIPTTIDNIAKRIIGYMGVEVEHINLNSNEDGRIQ